MGVIEEKIKDEYYRNLDIARDRVILHSDFNNFFASVELLSDPTLIDVPLAICGDEKERHGIVLAKNERAKRYGIKTGETVKSAREKCRDLVTRPARYSQYVKYSRMVRDIYLRYTPLVEPFGIDEAWLDVSALAKRRKGGLFGVAHDIAREIKNAVFTETGLFVSVGVSFNKVFAKLASDMKNEENITVISPENFREIVGGLKVNRILYVGRQTEVVLKRNRFFTLSDIARQNRSCLKEIFGKFGETVWDFSNGLDFSPVNVYTPEEKTDSISNSRTLPYDITSYTDAESVLFSICECVVDRMKSRGLSCSTVRIFVRWDDLSFITRQMKRDGFTSLFSDIFSDCSKLFRENVDFKKSVRSIGVAVENLQSVCREQISFFDFVGEFPKTKVDKAFDAMKKKFGDGIITRASCITKAELSHFDKNHPAFNHNL